MPALIPVWRLFRELDGYPEAACERLVVAAQVRRGSSAWAAWAAALAGAAAPLTLLAVLGDPRRDADVVMEGGRAAVVVLLMWIALPVAAGGCAALVVRAAQAYVALRRLLRAAACPRCGYTLHGLRLADPPGLDPNPAERRLRCPECGHTASLLSLGLSAIDLLPIERRIPDPGVGTMRGHARRDAE